MPYLALGVLVLLAVVAALRGYAYANPARLASAVRWTASGLAVFGAILLLFRELPVGILLLLIGIALPVIMHWQASWGGSRAKGGRAREGTSRINTKYLSLSLDHATGALDGEVLAGRHGGRRVAELTLSQLLEVRAECLVDDPDGVTLIEAYLDRVHGSDWRTKGAGEQSTSGDPGPATMTRDEAYEILGLAAGASEAEIREAHHRLMMKLHPDHGGSNYLAAKINQAKDLLLSA
ncbi:MAG TPA: DnaJ domain-containing protein [Methylomirabilota bacterium]|nr:DnaJ domain-containing protein [Methylomirabilota bacterium]